MPYQSVQRYFGLGKETSRGTAVAPTIWLPIAPNPSLTPQLSWLKNDALVGSPVEQIDDVPSVRHDEFDFKGNVFADTFGALLMAILGQDTVTGTAAPYTHAIGLANSPTTGSQPPSYTGIDTDNISESGGPAKQFTAGQLDSVTITFSADGALSYQAKYLSNPYTQVAAPSSSFSTEVFIPAWNGTISLGGSGVTVLSSGQIAIKRSTTAIHTVGQQSPYRLWAGAIDVSGKVQFIAEASDPTFASALSRNQQALVCTFTDPVSSHSVAFQMSKAQLKNPKVLGDKAWQEISADFTAQSNTTDAVASGYAPIKATVINGQSASY